MRAGIEALGRKQARKPAWCLNTAPAREAVITHLQHWIAL
jgi:hypothetical protein